MLPSNLMSKREKDLPLWLFFPSFFIHAYFDNNDKKATPTAPNIIKWVPIFFAKFQSQRFRRQKTGFITFNQFYPNFCTPIS